MEFLLVSAGMICLLCVVKIKTIHDQLRSTKQALEWESQQTAIYREVSKQSLDSYRQLVRKWNNLVDRVNAIGGEKALSGNVNTLNMSEDDIKRLLQLCHPDRHRNSDLSVEMTQKLLQLRDQHRKGNT